MGLGKTIQTLVFFDSLREARHAQLRSAHRDEQSSEPDEQAASLIVVTRSLLVNWQREAARFTPHLRLLEYFDNNRLRDLRQFDQYDLVITTYGVMLRDIALFRKYTFHYAVLDESQAIKNPHSQTARAARLLQARHRLVLTGTPVENSSIELWSQFAFLNPGLLGSLEYFKNEFITPIEKKGSLQTTSILRKLVYPFILRRTKDQVAPELPPRTERILYSDMEAGQRKMYNRTRDLYRGIVLGMLEQQGLNQSRLKILEGLLRLRQISNHPRLVDDKFRGESGKFELLIETLETLRAENHKALVFSQFVQMLRLVRNVLDERSIPYTYLDGQTRNRMGIVDTFQGDPNIPFFLISLRAGGQGLNLTAADYVIHIDPWWNPAVETQASDRTHRIGQDKPVFIFKMITRDSVEEKILTLQERKKKLVDQLIQTENAFFKSLTEEDVQNLFS
jgi:non-specific serine/threonine protein kinase